MHTRPKHLNLTWPAMPRVRAREEAADQRRAYKAEARAKAEEKKRAKREGADKLCVQKKVAGADAEVEIASARGAAREWRRYAGGGGGSETG